MKEGFPLIVLRPASRADEAFRFTVYATTRADELADWGWPPEQQTAFLNMQFSAQERGHAAAFPAATRSIIYMGEIPIGVLMIHRSTEELRLIDIALLPAHRGCGAGTYVVRLLQAEARSLGCPFRLRLLRGNPARRLYARLGFALLDEDGLYVQMEWRADCT